VTADRESIVTSKWIAGSSPAMTAEGDGLPGYPALNREPVVRTPEFFSKSPIECWTAMTEYLEGSE